MNFFKSVFTDETTPPDSPNSPTDNQSNSGTWTFGDILKTLATKSDSVIETYRRDLQELSSGLKKETSVIRDVASRSFEAGASAAQESLESVGQAIDDIGSIVLKSTAQIVSHGNNNNHYDRVDTSISNNNKRDLNLGVKRYSRFENQVRVLQCDFNTYCNVPEDKDEFEKWRLEGFVLEEKSEEIDRICGENAVVREIHDEVVPNRVDNEAFWSRYFYRLYKLKQVEEARDRLVKRAISTDDEEDLSWDFDDDEEQGETPGNIEPEPDRNVGVAAMQGKVENSAAGVEGKGENGESCKDSDVSVVSSQSVPEEEELGWDQIEDVGSDDEKKREVVGSENAKGVDLRKRFSSAEEEEEDLSWDIEDEEDDSVKP